MCGLKRSNMFFFQKFNIQSGQLIILFNVKSGKNYWLVIKTTIILVVSVTLFLLSFGGCYGCWLPSWHPTLTMCVQQYLPCLLLCPVPPTFRFTPLQSTLKYPSNPSVCMCTLFTSTHTVMSVLVFVHGEITPPTHVWRLKSKIGSLS